MSDLPHPRLTFDLFGQDASQKILAEALESGRLHHSWLLQGPRGIGKATLAYRFARALLGAEEGGAPEPASPGLFGEEPAAPADKVPLQFPPEDPICRQISAGSHPDLMILERQVNPDTGKMRGEIPVEEVRRAIDFMHKTAHGNRRVVIVDSADDLNRSAANALLKILEEPPASAWLILVSHLPAQLLPTIRSRCQKLTLLPLSEPDVLKALQPLFPDATEAQRQKAANHADGSVTEACRWMEEDVAALQSQLQSLLDSLPNISWQEVHKLARDMAAAANEEKYRLLCDLLPRLLQRRIRNNPANDNVDIWLDQLHHITDLIRKTDFQHLDKKQTIITIFGHLAAEGQQ